MTNGDLLLKRLGEIVLLLVEILVAIVILIVICARIAEAETNIGVTQWDGMTLIHVEHRKVFIEANGYQQTTGSDTKERVIQVGVAPLYPLAHGFHLLGELGIGYHEVTWREGQSDNDVFPMVGGGVKWSWKRLWAALSYRYAHSNVDEDTLGKSEDLRGFALMFGGRS